MLSLFPDQKREAVMLTRLDGYRRCFVDYGFWRCENNETVVVEDDATPGFAEVRAAIECGICSRCCWVEPPVSADDEPKLWRGAPCWKC